MARAAPRGFAALKCRFGRFGQVRKHTRRAFDLFGVTQTVGRAPSQRFAPHTARSLLPYPVSWIARIRINSCLRPASPLVPFVLGSVRAKTSGPKVQHYRSVGLRFARPNQTAGAFFIPPFRRGSPLPLPIRPRHSRRGLAGQLSWGDSTMILGTDRQRKPLTAFPWCLDSGLSRRGAAQGLGRLRVALCVGRSKVGGRRSNAIWRAPVAARTDRRRRVGGTP